MTSFIQFPANKVIAQIDFSIYFGKSMRISVVWVAPQLAHEMLARNKNNRVIDPRHVRKLAAAIKEGLWDFNGQTSTFDWNGTMMDAQHRALAIISADTEIPMIIVEGLDPCAGDTIDTENKARSVANILQRRGVDVRNCGTHEAMARVFMATENGYNYGRTQIADWVEDYAEDWSPVVTWAYTLCKSAPVTKAIQGRSRAITPAALGAVTVWMATHGAGIDNIRAFAEGVVSGMYQTEAEKVTFNSLRRRYVQEVPLHIGGSAKNYPVVLGEMAIFIHTFNKWMAGDAVQVVRPFKQAFKTLHDLPKPVQGMIPVGETSTLRAVSKPDHALLVANRVTPNVMPTHR